MYFCPTCAMMLQYELPHMDRPARLFCPTCPYVCPIGTKIKSKRKQRVIKKDIDLIISKEDEAKYAQETEATCPKCGFEKAAFYQVQIRSADEPMSTFYECRKCTHHWRED